MEKQNDGLALIVGGLFILALVFATYNYFNKGNNSQDTLEKRIEQMQKEKDQEQIALDESTVPSEDKLGVGGEIAMEAGDINGDAVTTSNLGTQQVAAASVDQSWIPNNYNQGDITGDSYTVKKGDTLWEIAEAVYGNGADWVKILNANSSNIGYLPNGQQALIMPGQVLNLVR